MDKFWGKQGADAYIAKPVDQEELVRTVKQLIKVKAQKMCNLARR